MDRVEIRSIKLQELVDHIGARGGLTVEEAHEFGRIIQYRAGGCAPIKSNDRLRSENSRILVVVEKIGKRGGLDAEELVMRREII